MQAGGWGATHRPIWPSASSGSCSSTSRRPPLPPSGRLVPGGRFVFACWQGVEHNPWHLGSALRGLVPPPKVPAPGKSPVGPFALGDDEYVRELLEAAGFAEVRSTGHETTVRAPANAIVDPTLFGFMGIPPERQDEARAIAERHLEQFAVAGTGDGGGELYDYPLAFMIYEATTS